MLFNAISKVDSVTGLGVTALAEVMARSKVLQFFDNFNAFELDATAWNFMPNGDAIDVQTRAAGGMYDSKLLTFGAKIDGVQRFTGFSFTIDRSQLADVEHNLQSKDWYIKEVKAMIRKFGNGYDAVVMKGTGVAPSFLGLEIILDGTTSLPGYPGVTACVDAASEISGAHVIDLVTNATLFEHFFDRLDDAISEVENPTSLVMNRRMQQKMTHMANNLRVMNETLDKFNQKMMTYGGLPIFILDENAIGFTETDNEGTASTCTSIYITAAGEENFSFVTNSGLEYSESDADFVHGSTLMGEIRGGIKIQNKKAIRRLMHIKIK